MHTTQALEATYCVAKSSYIARHPSDVSIYVVFFTSSLPRRLSVHSQSWLSSCRIRLRRMKIAPKDIDMVFMTNGVGTSAITEMLFSFP